MCLTVGGIYRLACFQPGGRPPSWILKKFKHFNYWYGSEGKHAPPAKFGADRRCNQRIKATFDFVEESFDW